MAIWSGFLDILRAGLTTFTQLGGGNYVVGVILLTVAVRLVLLPLGLTQIRSMQKMARLAPRQQELRIKHKDDPQKFQMELMALYREEGVNPASGCLPLLLQLPVMYGLFEVLRTYPYHVGHGLLWLQNLNQPDPYYVLPVLVAVTTFLVQKQAFAITPPQPGTEGSQKMMLWMMPVVLGYAAARFGSGLSLYYVFSNIFQIGQTALFMRPAAAKPAAAVPLATRPVVRAPGGPALQSPPAPAPEAAPEEPAAPAPVAAAPVPEGGGPAAVPEAGGRPASGTRKGSGHKGKRSRRKSGRG
ncbi:membrane protein of unknown function [Candidatus Hydrogenisulfobacillus filiaventi]|uniref:Membrane insertase YidC/Oxa/ALB C-terminal domain-containing protein n=1 Tax=Candidatus Hydrogenisulfobacillus filiaventi TaxID=2707344 RepID=A0A6F8ZLD3_9FIRM|nr:YidC/Oxa1 family membrane protein insertase [Bacillota bacterium]CAB1130275.1 membrane protein of unknown function [Candidatus Hydrogenisulfobacillus filiaventi]